MEYILSLMPSILGGAAETMKIFIVTLIGSIPLGIVFAIIRRSKLKLLARIMSVYILIMRGTPLMLQIVFIFFGLPAVGISLDRYLAVLVAFILNYSAYFAEIFRGGIETIDRGQYEAAKVLGFSSYKSFTRIIFPQVFKNILPSLSNEIITLVKDTSLVYIVGIGELLRAGKIASNRDASLIPLVLVGAVYLLITWVLTIYLNGLEKKYSYYE